MKKLNLVLVLFWGLVIGCQNNTHLIHQEEFSIRLPKTMFNAKGQMLEKALLEYADTVKNLFVIVEKRQMPYKKNHIDSARQDFVDFFIKDDTIPNTYKLTKLNDSSQMVEAVTIDLQPDFSSLQTYWVVGIFKADSNNYYIVWAWTDRSFKPDNEKTLKKIIKSFKIKKK
jgi:hypothetical protein